MLLCQPSLLDKLRNDSKLPEVLWTIFIPLTNIGSVTQWQLGFSVSASTDECDWHRRIWIIDEPKRHWRYREQRYLNRLISLLSATRQTVTAAGAWRWVVVQGMFLVMYVRVLICIFSVWLCVFEKRAPTGSPPSPTPSSCTELFKKWKTAGCSPSSCILIEHTPLIYNLCPPSAQENRWRIGWSKEWGTHFQPYCLKKIRQTLVLVPPLTVFGRVCKGSNSNYHSTEAKAPALNQCGGSVMCVSSTQTQALNRQEIHTEV